MKFFSTALAAAAVTLAGAPAAKANSDSTAMAIMAAGICLERTGLLTRGQAIKATEDELLANGITLGHATAVAKRPGNPALIAQAINQEGGCNAIVRKAGVNRRSPINQRILSFCSQRWGIDYRMVKHCVDKQSKAATSLGL